MSDIILVLKVTSPINVKVRTVWTTKGHSSMGTSKVYSLPRVSQRLNPLNLFWYISVTSVLSSNPFWTLKWRITNIQPLEPLPFFISLYIIYVERERENEGERGGFIGLESPQPNLQRLNPQLPTTRGLDPTDVEPNPLPTPYVILMA